MKPSHPLSLSALALALSATVATSQQRICTPITGPIHLQTYSEKGDSAAFMVDQLGNVLARPTQPIDENDRVTVHLITTEAVSKLMRVQRASAIRSVSVINVLGGGLNITETKDVGAMMQAAPCDLAVPLADFAPGKGEVQISLLYVQKDTSIKTVQMGSFDFTVQPLYIGAFTLGPVISKLKRPKFGTVVAGADTLATQVETDQAGINYALFFTPFLGGKRDIEKGAKGFWRRFGLSLGVPLTGIGHEALFGGTFALPYGLYLHGGAHVGETTELDPNSGGGIGKPVHGGVVATRKARAAAAYYGVTLDLKVMLKLIQTAGGTTIP